MYLMKKYGIDAMHLVSAVEDLTGKKLVSTVSGLLAEPGRLAAMGRNARTLSVDDSLDRIADALMKLVKTP